MAVFGGDSKYRTDLVTVTVYEENPVRAKMFAGVMGFCDTVTSNESNAIREINSRVVSVYIRDALFK